MRALLPFAAPFAVLATACAPATAPQLLPAVASFPPGPERETFLRICSGCHAADIVAQKRLTPQDWQKMVDLMVDQATATDQERAAITAYLSRSFPAAK